MSDLDLISYFDNSEKCHAPKGWRVSPPYSIPKEADTVKRMVDELSAIPFEKRKGPTHFNGKPVAELTAEERKEMIFSMQQPSTQKALLLQKTRKPSEDHAWANRPIPKEAIARPDATTVEDAIGERRITPQEMNLIEANRRGQKNTIGTSELKTASAEKRAKAIHAFTYSKPALPTPEEIGRLKQMKETGAIHPGASPSQEPELKRKPKGILQKVSDWFIKSLGYTTDYED